MLHRLRDILKEQDHVLNKGQNDKSLNVISRPQQNRPTFSMTALKTTAKDGRLRLTAVHLQQDNWVRFAKKRLGRLLPLLLWLSKAYTVHHRSGQLDTGTSKDVGRYCRLTP